jgi:hypothetical protein
MMIADFDRADFGNTIRGGPAAGGLDVNDDIILLRIEAVIHAADLGLDPRVTKLTQARQLIASDDVAFGLDFQKGDLTVLRQHQVGKPVAHAPKILAHAAENPSDASKIAVGQEHAKRVDVNVIPGEDAVRAPPSRGNALENQIECIPRTNGRKLRFYPTI